MFARLSTYKIVDLDPADRVKQFMDRCGPIRSASCTAAAGLMVGLRWRMAVAGWLASVVLIAVAALFAPIGLADAAVPRVQTFNDEGSFGIGPCPSTGITLIETFTEDDRIITFFDEAGAPVRVQVHINFEGVVTNPATGQTLRDPAHETRFIDLTTNTRGPAGLVFSTTVPGGGVVFHDVGRLLRTFDDRILFEAGPHDVLHGDYVALWCAAFGA